jgi:hypothetical protein
MLRGDEVAELPCDMVHSRDGTNQDVRIAHSGVIDFARGQSTTAIVRAATGAGDINTPLGCALPGAPFLIGCHQG